MARRKCSAPRPPFRHARPPMDACRAASRGCLALARSRPRPVSGGATTPPALFPSGAISDERIVQLDVKVTKNFRFGRVSVQPLVEAFNLMNIDQVRSRVSSVYGNTTGGYLQPNTMLPGRIIGFGANLKW
jgi:hypothetical protein